MVIKLFALNIITIIVTFLILFVSAQEKYPKDYLMHKAVVDSVAIALALQFISLIIFGGIIVGSYIW